jgi:hypothetical protein
MDECRHNFRFRRHVGPPRRTKKSGRVQTIVEICSRCGQQRFGRLFLDLLNDIFYLPDAKKEGK